MFVFRKRRCIVYRGFRRESVADSDMTSTVSRVRTKVTLDTETDGEPLESSNDTGGIGNVVSDNDSRSLSGKDNQLWGLPFHRCVGCGGFGICDGFARFLTFDSCMLLTLAAICV